MKHIIKVEILENLPKIRPLIAMDNDKKLWWEGKQQYNGLKFTSNGTSTISAQNIDNRDIKYSLDNGNTWNQLSSSAITLQNNEIMWLKGNNPTGFNQSNSYMTFLISGSIAASGNIMGLIDNGECNTLTIPNNYCFYKLFYNCSSLTTPPKLPATTLTNNCYQGMFYGCTSLTTPPELRATRLTEHCYSYMFCGCTSLTTPPELPATTLANNCYFNMFYGCTSLTIVPELPALILAKKCYQGMFYNCSSLITSMKILPATDLLETNWSMAGYGNSNSNYSGVDSRAISEGVYSHMFAHCTSLTTAPILPAKQLSPGCYNAMFHACKKLTKVIILAENLHVNISDESFNTVVDLANEYNGQANKDWMELNAAVCWIDHSGNVTTRKFHVPESAIKDWNSQTTYFTHVFPDNMEIIPQEEIDNIIKQYHIVY